MSACVCVCQLFDASNELLTVWMETELTSRNICILGRVKLFDKIVVDARFFFSAITKVVFFNDFFHDWP